MKSYYIYFALFFLAGCAQLHHVQLGEVESDSNYVQKPFDIKISETGVSIDEAASLSKAFLNKERGQDAQSIANIIGLFQMGPTTGKPVYTNGYAKNLIQVIYEKCPSGRVTGLTSVRESRNYPVVSGEIVKLTGYCLLKKGG